jgi:hypothetical protein
MARNVIERPPADDGAGPAQPIRKHPESRSEASPDDDTIRSGSDIDQGSVEVEKQGKPPVGGKLFERRRRGQRHACAP